MNVKNMTNEQNQINLEDYMRLVIRQLNEEKKHPSVHTYTCTLRSYAKFFGCEKRSIPVSEVFTPGKLKEYQDWLRQKGKSWNTVSTYMRVMRAIYNRILPPNSAEYNPKLFDDVYTKVESQTKRALTGKQMQTLMATNFNTLPDDIKSALAYFLLMFLFRGMPFIDLAYLRKTDMKGNTIVYCRHKTGKQMTVRIPREAAELMKLYKNKNPDSPYLFPILDNKLKNEWKLYRCYLEAIRNFNKKLEKIGRILLPGSRISSYTARHTWATLAFYLGIPIGIISQALGHSSIRVTETYLKPFESEKIDKANNKLITAVTLFKAQNTTTYNFL